MRPLLAILILLPALVGAETAVLRPGDSLPRLKLNDQHEQPYAMPGNARVLLVTADKASGGLAHEVLKDIPQAEQERRGIVYVADVSGMPSLVTHMFALPKMREYGYRIMLGMEPGQTAMLPRAADAVTLVELESGRIKSVEEVRDVPSLKARLSVIAP
ncbi:MAG: hypothetical protein ABWU16_02950 [Halothiobacillaceae bacterium]